MEISMWETQLIMDQRLLDKNWRLRHLYTIKDRNQNKIQFKPNRAQQHFNANKHTRNIILKSRRLGFTTFKAIGKAQDRIKELYKAESPHWSNITIIITNIQLLDEVDV